MALNKRKINSVIAELKRHQKDLAKKRDQLQEVIDTASELGEDVGEAISDIEDAVTKLSRLQ